MTIATSTRRTTLAIAVLAAAAALTTIASADPVDGNYSDVPGCDDHGDRSSTEEFGSILVFQPSQWADPIFWQLTPLSACPATDDPGIPNVLIITQNITGRDLTDLFYVGDIGKQMGIGETTFSNQDGVATQFGQPGMAFRIDDVGANQPLVFEDIVAGDGIWQAGEWWHFIVQDYVNTAGATPDGLTSVGYADGSSFDLFGSSGSIVQFPQDTTPCPGDIDGNGSRDTVDLLRLLGNWGNPGEGDFDGDGIVGVLDLLSLLGLWGPCP